MLNLRLTLWTTTLFATISFILCVLVGFLLPHDASMHRLLELLLPGFTWISLPSFLLGLVESALWGVYLGGGFALIQNVLYRRGNFRAVS
nr:DUF5676 family membrane protein [Nitrosomonas nitrosa]